MLKHYDERTEFPDETDTCATVFPSSHTVGGRAQHCGADTGGRTAP